MGLKQYLTVTGIGVGKMRIGETGVGEMGVGEMGILQKSSKCR